MLVERGRERERFSWRERKGEREAMGGGGLDRRSLLGYEEEGKEEEEEEEDGGKSEELLLTVNKAYAKRFMHNKEREDLHRLQELQKRGLLDSATESDPDDDEDEDEDGLFPVDVDMKIYDVLARIKHKDPEIYKPDAIFFDEMEDGENPKDGADEMAEKKKTKPAYLKDVIASQLLQGDAADAEAVANPSVSNPRVSRTYAQEQQELKDAFMRSVADADDEEDDALLRVRKKSGEEIAREKLEDDTAVAEYEQRKKDADINRRLEEYFGKNDDLDENEQFLKDYLLNKAWIDRDRNYVPCYEDIVEFENEEVQLEEQEKFEGEYNFRFEEGAGSQVLGHSRVIETSARKKLDSRKKKRKQKMERLDDAAHVRREELKRLKNLKRKEILEKLSMIRSVAGAASDSFAAGSLGADDLEEDFDPDDYDQKMKELFGADYYNDQDADSNFMANEEEHFAKSDFDAEDELLGLDNGCNNKTKAGFSAVRELQKQAYNLESAVGNEKVDSEEPNVLTDAEDNAVITGKKHKTFKNKIALLEKLSFDKKLEDYYKLDYEDMIGDLPTRFKYHQVKANTYGMTTEEILIADDKELNQYVSVKKLAPYRSDEWVPRGIHHLSKKTRKLQSLDQVPSYRSTGNQNSFKKKKSLKLQGDALETVSEEASKNESEMNGNPNEDVQKKRKRRKKVAVAQMSFSRLLSYGKVNLPAKKRKK